MGDSAPIQVLGINIDLLMRDYADGRRYTQLKLMPEPLSQGAAGDSAVATHEDNPSAQRAP